jgi:hypothetical protein
MVEALVAYYKRDIERLQHCCTEYDLSKIIEGCGETRGIVTVIPRFCHADMQTALTYYLPRYLHTRTSFQPVKVTEARAGAEEGTYAVTVTSLLC